jgi:lipoate-protein ligase A
VTAGWPVVRHRGTAASLHALEVPTPARAELWWMQMERPAVVLGSTQRPEIVDRRAAERLGLAVVRRRSGGGAVLLEPDDVTWVDVVLPADDPRWVADVGRSFDWLGRAWIDALGAVGVAGAIAHEGPLLRSPWSDLVCFAGLGPGEVRVDGRKVVGLSQRRTRGHARFQCLAVHRWDPTPLLEVLVPDPADRSVATVELAASATGIGPVAPAALVGALARALGAPTSLS